MIVRISGENQYRLADEDSAKLNELENAVVAAVEAGREEDYPSAFAAVLDYVRSRGEIVADEDLEGSDVIIPPADLSFKEAGREFTGEGLIPD
jgi:hypothetical protein